MVLSKNQPTLSLPLQVLFSVAPGPSCSMQIHPAMPSPGHFLPAGMPGPPGKSSIYYTINQKGKRGDHLGHLLWHPSISHDNLRARLHRHSADRETEAQRGATLAQDHAASQRLNWNLNPVCLNLRTPFEHKLGFRRNPESASRNRERDPEQGSGVTAPPRPSQQPTAALSLSQRCRGKGDPLPPVLWTKGQRTRLQIAVTGIRALWLSSRDSSLWWTTRFISERASRCFWMSWLIVKSCP